jgi:hypothetical protein
MSQEKPLPQVVVRRQTELLTRIHNSKALLPSGLAPTKKVMGELDTISRATINNDR